MSLHETFDKAAVCFGLVTGVALLCAGAELEAACMAGGLVALVADVPFGSITNVCHQGTIHSPHPKTRRRPTKVHLPKPTGYHYGAFGRL